MKRRNFIKKLVASVAVASVVPVALAKDEERGRIVILKNYYMGSDPINLNDSPKGIMILKLRRGERYFVHADQWEAMNKFHREREQYELNGENPYVKL